MSQEVRFRGKDRRGNERWVLIGKDVPARVVVTTQKSAAVMDQTTVAYHMALRRLADR